MNKPYRDIVLDILSVINYPKDRTSYAEEAEKAVFTDLFINLSEKLPEDIKQHIEASKTDFKPFTEEDVEKVRQHISPEEFVQELERLYKEDIKEFVEELKPTVNNDQKGKLDAIVASLDEVPAAESAAPMADAPADPSQMVPPPPPPVPSAPAPEAIVDANAAVAQPQAEQPQTDVTKPQETTV